MKADWVIVPRGDVQPQYAGLYVTMNPAGDIVMSRATMEKLGGPEAFILKFDRANKRIGLEPAEVGAENAYPARVANSRSRSRLVRGHRLTKDHAVMLPHTVHFKDASVDEDGMLVLDLRTAVVSNRARKHRSRKAEVGSQ